MHTIPEPIAAFHEAVNAADGAAAAALAVSDVEVGGPRGAARGVDLLRGWVERSGIRLTPLAAHHGAGGAVVVTQHATWPGDETVHEIATLFRLSPEQRLTAVIRYDTPAQALAAAGVPVSR
ncbi:nuclear transport factor 2 family protein [Phytohabitans houttuyneae]|nr:nuclear transport factor 2 family protein [Phytohabitans houttuyneae]